MVYYIIDGVNERFRTLKNAKHHIWVAYTQRERFKYLYDAYICKVVNDEVVTVTKINVTTDGYSFSKPIKL